MLSGNGRHRRPRQAPALLVAAGVTGSAIAIPLLGATSAGAADGTAWDQVAECETGGSWSQNTGNGYYGGLQLTQEDWEAYGGLDFASSADRASRSQQIAVAERILAEKGASAWPTCGLLAGLDDDSGDAGVDTGVSESPDTSDSSGLSGSLDGSGESSTPEASSPPPSSSPDETATDSSDSTDESGDSGASGDSDASPAPSESAGSTQQDEPDKSGQGDGLSGGAETGGTGTGRHRGPSAPEGAGDGREDGSSGRHASRDSAAARDAGDGTYTVRAGDSLWAIADSLDLRGGWRELYAANEEAIGGDPDLILPGQKLAVQGESVEK
ncbi:transglycosylase family protein [Streptomyces sp. DH24]|uniref:LysM peptidoglycan-binding domain-containing protein n=1 Tax=Streptomyces sp. DH24 TaxID=3040123 RepID=UPI002440F93B|nr:transglycosylase family protein [Streptomyces sp. DH24]MDG9719115.1 transglycosylase family protein [Streptomyces sp. DH24]